MFFFDSAGLASKSVGLVYIGAHKQASMQAHIQPLGLLPKYIRRLKVEL